VQTKPAGIKNLIDPTGSAAQSGIGLLDRLLIFGLFAAGIVFLIYYNVAIPSGEEQFVGLAQSFLKGHLYFDHVLTGLDDTAAYEGRYYWPLGPASALLLLPAVAVFGSKVEQGYFQIAINLLILVLLFRIAGKITKNRNTAFWLAFAYVFSTAYLYVGLVPWSWYFAQVVGTVFLLLALNEFLYRRRLYLVGVYLAFAVTARINLVWAGIFFAGSLLLQAGTIRERVQPLVQLTLPVMAALGLLLLYNYLRFGSFLEFGYSYQLLAHEPVVNREHGLWSFVHFPANLFYFLFKGPEPVFLPGSKILIYPFLQADIWGLSIFFSSPILLWALRAPVKEQLVWLSVVTSLVMLFVILGYYGIGVRQYGYRYALDFYPFLFLMLAYVCREGLSLPMRAVIVISFLFNSYLILDSWFPRPVI
jgi:hypothetical protein